MLFGFVAAFAVEVEGDWNGVDLSRWTDVDVTGVGEGELIYLDAELSGEVLERSWFCHFVCG